VFGSSVNNSQEMKFKMPKTKKEIISNQVTSNCQNQSQTKNSDSLEIEVKTSKVPNHFIKVIGSPITALPFDAQIKTIVEWASSHESRVVCVANVHMVMEAYWYPEFSSVLKSADIVTPDGMPLVWMMRLMGECEQNRVAGMDILLSVCKLAQEGNLKVFFLGSKATILESMKKKLEQEFPKLQITGMEPLPFRPLTLAEENVIIQKIHQSDSKVVFVSLGCPKQEYWMNQHKGKIQAVMIGLGGVFPVLAEVHKRAPLWLRNAGLEWLYRLIQEPRRLWGRYMNTIPPFIYLALRQLLISKLRVKSFSSD